MSIYRRRNWYDTDSKQEDGKAAAPLADERDWSKVRKAAPTDCLLPVAKAWMESLPPKVSLAALAAQYPRIVNHIALAWKDRDACRAYFEELLVDSRRGDRQGFPDAVERELEGLREYWYNGLRP